MQRKWMWIAALGVAAVALGSTAKLHANIEGHDNSNGFALSDDGVWFVQQEAAIAKDQEAMGILAVDQAATLEQGEAIEKQIDFFQKMLADTKSHAVQRHIRMKLAELYSKSDRPDNALEQLQILMTEPI